MGYIFDALNRAGKNPVKPVAPPPDADQAKAPSLPLEPPLGSVPEDADASFAGDPRTLPPEAAPPVAPLASEPLSAPEVNSGAAPAPAPTEPAGPHLKLNPSAEPAPARETPAAEPARLALVTAAGPFDERLVALRDPSSVMAEEYRSIRTGLLARWQNKRHLVHTITSATPQEGKTITSLNLGLSFAELHNRRTVVVEADLRLPTFSKLLGLPSREPGLVEVLNGEASLASVMRRVGDTQLLVIPCGRRAHDQAVQLVSSAAMLSVLKSLRQRFDHIVIDTPPVAHLADAGILGALSDDVLLVVRMERTPRPLVDQAVRALARYNAPVAGMIATDQKQPRGRYYRKYGYHYHYYHQHRKEAA